MSTKKNAAYNVAYRMFSVFLPLVTAPYLSRTVGTDGVGLYSLAWSVSYVFCLIGMLGLNDYGVRTIAQVRDNREELDRTFSAIWQMQLLVAGATLVAWLGYVFLVAGEEKVIALHLTMMSVSCLVSLDWCLMGLDIFKPIALRNTFVKLAAAACVFLFVKKKEDLWIYGFVWSLATLIGNLMSAASLRGKVTYRPVPIRESLKHLKPCAVLFISVLAVNVYRTMDKVMVSAIAGVHENGLYENAEKIARHIDRSMELILCMTSAMAFGVAAVADVFAPLFYGEDFRYSGTLMAPLAFTLIMIGFANVIRTQVVLPQKRDHIFVKSVCCGAAVNLIANACLIPSMKSMGAVVGTLMAEMTVPVVQYIILRKELPYGQFLKYVGIYAVFGGIMLGCVRLVKTLVPAETWLSLGIMTAAGIAVYAGLCIGYWKMTKKNFRELNQ